uniref:Uncharacterized protein n=1 Tax=Ustilago esculenta TaxID=185366 RepID=A0A481SG43_9BASI|nr:hypothetical protein UEMT_2043 [Ustilago esculenta]
MSNQLDEQRAEQFVAGTGSFSPSSTFPSSSVFHTVDITSRLKAHGSSEIHPSASLLRYLQISLPRKSRGRSKSPQLALSFSFACVLQLEFQIATHNAGWSSQK